MPEYSVAALLQDVDVTLTGIRSKRYPRGHSYTFTSPDTRHGLWLRDLLIAGRKVNAGEHTDSDLKRLAPLDDGQELDVYRQTMGSTLDELAADGVRWSDVQTLFTVLLQHWGMGEAHTFQLIAEAAREQALIKPKTTARKRTAPVKTTSAKKTRTAKKTTP